MKSAKTTSPVGCIRLTWPDGGDGVGALIVGDGVGEQDLIVLAQLDMALGDCQSEILVVLQLVGGDEHRRVLAAAGATLLGRRAFRRRERGCQPRERPA